MTEKNEIARLQKLAYEARRDLCKMCGAYSGNVHMGGDMSMILAFLYIVIVILAFVFSITISNNITNILSNYANEHTGKPSVSFIIFPYNRIITTIRI